ncbi:MAG: YraN family protein [Dermatophilaceae bacterium]
MSSSRGMPHGIASAVGEYGERMAERYLRDRGLHILARNWRCPLGEIDLVARDGGVLVVCEVKTRRGSALATPLDAVTPRKLARLRRLAAAWLEQQDGGFSGVRVDVVAVVRPRSGPCQVEHLVGVA